MGDVKDPLLQPDKMHGIVGTVTQSMLLENGDFYRGQIVIEHLL